MAQKGVEPLLSCAPSTIKGWKGHFDFVSSSLMGNYGLPNWGQLATPLLSASKLNAKERAHFEILDKF